MESGGPAAGAALEKAVQLVRADGSVVSGAEAGLAAVALRPGFGWALALYRRLAPLRHLLDGTYALVSRHRYRL